MNPADILNQLVIGLSIASIYVLVSLGLTIIFGLLNVLNFTHGVIYALGAYVGYGVVTATGSFWLALLVAPMVVGGVGLIIELVCVRRLWRHGHLIQFLATYGVALIIEELIRIAMGDTAYSIDRPAFLSGTLSVGPVEVASYRVFLIVAAGLVCLLVGLGLGRTRWGAIIRATSEDDTMAALLRVNTRAVLSIVFALGCGLAAVGGVLAAPVFSIHPSMGTSIIAGAFLVATVGGMGSIKGTILCSLIIGETASLGALWVGPFSDVVVLALMALLLMLRPHGLMPVMVRGGAA